jgi:hypothetical protein
MLLNFLSAQKGHKVTYWQAAFGIVYIHIKQIGKRGCNEVFFT